MTFRRKFLNETALSLMGIPVMYQGATWKDFEFNDPKLEKLLRGYTAYCHKMREDCINLIFCGANGTGKTFACSIILQYCYSYYFTTRMTTFKNLVNKVFSGQDIQEFLTADFLVIDELGAEVDLKTGSEKSLLEDILKQRFSQGLPTLICSNLDFNQLKQRYGNTFFSMLSEFIQVRVVGEDGRRKAFRKKSALDLLR